MLHQETTGLQRLLTADVDGDGRIEILLLNYIHERPSEEQSLYIYDSDDGEAWRLVYSTRFTDIYGFHSTAALAAADFNGSGTAETVVSNDNGFIWLLTFENGSYSLRTQWEVPQGGAIGSGMASGDVDGDGQPELLLGTNGGHIYVYDFTAALQPVHVASTLTNRLAYGVSSGDVNGDGVDEFVLGRGGLGYAETTEADVVVEVYKLHDGNLGRWWSTAPGQVDSSPFTLTFDFDMDGLDEIVVVSQGRVQVLRPQPQG